MGEEGLAPNNESPHESHLSTLVGQYVGQNRRQRSVSEHSSVDNALGAFTREVVSLIVRMSPKQRCEAIEALNAILAKEPTCSSKAH